MTKQFVRLVSAMVRNVDSKSPHLWADVQINDYWGMGNHNLSTDEGNVFLQLRPFYSIRSADTDDNEFKADKHARLQLVTWLSTITLCSSWSRSRMWRLKKSTQ